MMCANYQKLTKYKCPYQSNFKDLRMSLHTPHRKAVTASKYVAAVYFGRIVEY